MKLNFIFKKKSLFESPFGELRGKVVLHLQLVGKLVFDSIFVIVELFRYLLRLRQYKRKSVEVAAFRRGGHFERKYSEGRGRYPPTTVGVRKLE